ncbi:MAG: hypothetical protein JRJ24_12470, partial [Deltaproteobacteria bacterium]|nr:hypothetical protein [Deltaproteobacteria bacterium]
VKAARNPHHFLSVTKQGLTAIVATKGNLDCHVILRGGGGKPNYQPEHVAETVEMLKGAGLEGRLMVDCSHANSGKDHEKQAGVAMALGEQIAQGGTGVFGVMLESFLVGGRQNSDPGAELTYGQSITDACMSWDGARRLGATAPKRRRLNEAASVREIFSCGRARPQERSERHVRTAFGG